MAPAASSASSARQARWQQTGWRRSPRVGASRDVGEQFERSPAHGNGRRAEPLIRSGYSKVDSGATNLRGGLGSVRADQAPWGRMVYFSDLLVVLRRRWRIFLAGFLLAGVASVGIVMYVPTQYQASGDVLFLLPPKTAAGPINPYLNLQNGLSVAASIVGGVVTTRETQLEVARAGFTSPYAVAQSPQGGVPLLSVSAEDSNPEMAVKTVSEVIRRIGSELNQMQVNAGAPASQFMGISEFSITPKAEALHGSKLRALGVALTVIILGTSVVAFSVDGSRRRKDARVEAGPSDAVEPEGRRARQRRPRRRPVARRYERRRVPGRRASAAPHVEQSMPDDPAVAAQSEQLAQPSVAVTTEAGEGDLELAGWWRSERLD